MINEKDLENVRLEPCNLGGTGRKYFVTINGKRYIYKPAEGRYDHVPEPFRGLVQEAAYHIQNILDPKTSVYCIYVNNGKLNGTLQEYVDVSRRNLLGIKPEDLTESQIQDLIREFVTDFLLCNYDCHASNMIIDINGRIRGIDKEQSFRYINEKESEKPNLTFHPNRRYGEQPPYYYQLFKAYKDGKIKIDLKVLNYYLEKVENLDNIEFGKIIIPYIEKLNITKEAKKELLTKIIYRKHNLKKNIQDFITSLNVKEEKHSLIEPIPKDYVEGFNELLNNLKRANIEFNPDTVINFYNLFRSTNVELFLYYKNSNNKLIDVALKRLHIKDINTHGKEIFKFFYQNMNSSYVFHITNATGYESIYKAGMNPQAKNEVTDEIARIYSILSPASRTTLFPVAMRDNDMFSYSTKSMITSSNYGYTPEWFDFLTGSFSKTNNYEKAETYLINVLVTNKESQKTIIEVLQFMKKYWNKYTTNKKRKMIFIPYSKVNYMTPWDTFYGMQDDSYFKKYFSDITERLLDGLSNVNGRTSTIIFP